MRGLMMMAMLVASPAMAAVAAVAGKSSTSDMKLLVEARRSAADLTRDPAATQFRKIRKVTDGGVVQVCGEMNAKNAFGGYSGFKLFTYFPKSGRAFVFEPEDDGEENVKARAVVFGACF